MHHVVLRERALRDRHCAALRLLQCGEDLYHIVETLRYAQGVIIMSS